MATTDEPRTTETWIFAGTRVAANKTGAAIWVDPTGRELWFGAKGASIHAIGRAYHVEVIRDGDRVTMYGSPQYVAASNDPDPRAAEWRAADAAARARLAGWARERKAARQDPLDEALAPLLDIAAKLRTNADRDAFAAYILRRVLNA